MNDQEKSELPIRATKLANKAEQSAAESVEQRGSAKGNAIETTTRRTPSRESVSPGLDRVRQTAKGNRKCRFTALMHHVTLELLRQSYFWLKRNAAAGVDGVTWRGYGDRLEDNLTDLHGRVHRGAYRALPSRRRMIPKPDGRERPLGIASLEDKIVQRAIVEVLNSIYEADFVGFSYGFRPGRGQHDALDALAHAICSKKVNWIVDADLRSFFDTVDHEWLIRFLEHRIGDRRLIRLIRRWLKAGVMDAGVMTATTVGTPQGAVISPLLANVYLHYVFDLWADRWRHRTAQGEAVFVRYADDIVAGFQHETDATAFLADLGERLATFALSLHPEKTRVLAFGRFAAERRAEKGLGLPETFTFLGFNHICSTTRGGAFQLKRFARRDRMRLTLQSIGKQLHKRKHDSIPEQGRWLGQVVRGYFAYHAVPTNTAALKAFRFQVMRHWRHALIRRSQRHHITWDWMNRLVDQWLPRVRISHPWPSARFVANHPR
jgi:group II intron reverse transcriptase/maturase